MNITHKRLFDFDMYEKQILFHIPV